MQLDESTKVAPPTEETDSGDSTDPYRPKTLLPCLKRLPANRVVHAPNITSDPITFSLSYDDSDNQPLPPGVLCRNNCAAQGGLMQPMHPCWAVESAAFSAALLLVLMTAAAYA